GMGSIIGDMPGLVDLQITPTGASNYPAGTWLPDYLSWSLSARPSFLAHLKAGSITNIGVAQGSLLGDAFAPASQTRRVWVSGTTAATQWQNVFVYSLDPTLEPAYRGRYRVGAWLSLTPSIGAPVYCSADVSPGADRLAMASAAPIATLAPQVASGSPGGF